MRTRAVTYRSSHNPVKKCRRCNRALMARYSRTVGLCTRCAKEMGAVRTGAVRT